MQFPRVLVPRWLAARRVSLRRRTLALEVFEDRALLATFVVTNVHNSGEGSLRQAIVDANESAGPDFIHFSISGGGVQTIRPSFLLPEITDQVFIDATTQPGFSASHPQIEIDGSLAGETNGLDVRAGGCLIQGLIINNFHFDAIALAEPVASPVGGSTIRFNFLGTDATGMVAKPNRIGLHLVGSPNNVISDNLVSGNRDSGIELDFATSRGNQIKANLIGTNIMGNESLGNGLDGLYLGAPNVTFLRQGNDDPRGYASDNVIGGTDPLSRNIISGNLNSGVHLFRGSGNKFEGNYIGIGKDGLTPVSNGTDPGAIFGREGIWIEEGSANTIGGVQANAGNVISANRGSGVKISSVLVSASQNTVQGNLIGTNASGEFGVGLGNSGNGIELRNESTAGAGVVEVAENKLGGVDADDGDEDDVILARNVISGNAQSGILIVGHRMRANAIRGNLIGLDKAGTGAVRNVLDGIEITVIAGQDGTSSETLIGGVAAGAGNIVRPMAETASASLSAPT